MLIDRYLPTYDFAERHETVVQAHPDRVYQAALTTDISQSWMVRSLFALRGLPRLFRQGASRPGPRAMTLKDFTQGGFISLADDPPVELLLGLIGQFWRPTGSMVRTDSHGFLAFAQPGFAKAVWNFSLEPRPDGATVLRTETRIRCLDEQSRRRFRLYWLLIRPFSGLIRNEMLRLVRRSAEGTN